MAIARIAITPVKVSFRLWPFLASGQHEMNPKNLVIVTNAGVDAPADWLAAEGEAMVKQMLSGWHAGFNAMLQVNPHADPAEIMGAMLSQACANWRNVGEFAQ